MGAVLGISKGSRLDVINEREAAFQKYFDVLCGRDEVVRTHIFQAALAVYVPEPVAHLRIKAWLPSNSKGERALLEIRAEGQQMESSAVVEAYHVTARVIQDDQGDQKEARLVDLKIPAAVATSDAGWPVEALPAGAQVELEAYAENAVGLSPPVSIRFIVPQSSASSSTSSGSVQDASAEASSSEGSSSSSSAFHDSKTTPIQEQESVLEQRRLELEQWWSKKQEEAEREEAERQREMEEFRAQREALQREREELVMERQRSSSPHLSSPACCSPVASPRELKEGEADALQKQQEELHRKASHLARAEEALCTEKLELQRSRASLAIMQAHVVNMLDQAEANGSPRLHRLDIVDDAETGANSQAEEVVAVVEEADDEALDEDISDPALESPCIDKVWTMDWTNPVIAAAVQNSIQRDLSAELPVQPEA
jgi:hypothetical protein